VTDTKQRCIVLNCGNHRHEGKFVGDLCVPCYTFISTGDGVYSQAYRNVQREWVSLTDEEFNSIYLQWYEKDGAYWELRQSIEAKLKERNS